MDIQYQQFGHLITYHTENKHTLYHGKDCMKMFCTSSGEHAKNIAHFEKKNVAINKRKIKITSRSKSMLYLWKNVGILHVNIEVQHIVFVI